MWAEWGQSKQNTFQPPKQWSRTKCSGNDSQVLSHIDQEVYHSLHDSSLGPALLVRALASVFDNMAVNVWQATAFVPDMDGIHHIMRVEEGRKNIYTPLAAS